MNNEKNFLDGAGLEALVTFIKEQLATKLNIDDARTNYAKKSDLNSYATTATLDTYATKNYVDNSQYDDTTLLAKIAELEAKIASVYKFKGSVNDLEELYSITVLEPGDVYNVEDTGMNYAWTGTEWDNFGGPVIHSNEGE